MTDTACLLALQLYTGIKFDKESNSYRISQWNEEWGRDHEIVIRAWLMDEFLEAASAFHDETQDAQP